MLTKDGRDTPIEKLTADNYIVPKGEERAYHVVIEVRQFDQKTGKRISTPRIQKFGKKSFESNIADSLRKQGYDMLILHDPNEWIKAQQAKAEAKAKADAEAKAKAEQERFDKAVQEAVAKALAARENADIAETAEPAETSAKAANGRKKAKEQE